MLCKIRARESSINFEEANGHVVNFLRRAPYGRELLLRPEGNLQLATS